MIPYICSLHLALDGHARTGILVSQLFDVNEFLVGDLGTAVIIIHLRARNQLDLGEATIDPVIRDWHLGCSRLVLLGTTPSWSVLPLTQLAAIAADLADLSR